MTIKIPITHSITIVEFVFQYISATGSEGYYCDKHFTFIQLLTFNCWRYVSSP